MITIHDLEHHYNGAPVLRIPALRIAPKTIVGLVGPNGSGKSTLLRLMACVEVPARGTLCLEDRPLRPLDRTARRRITLLPQEPYLMHRTVFDNVRYGLKVRGVTRGVEDAVARALEWVGLPFDAFARRRWEALSGGETQRVALAARLVLQPDALLLDEPTASVDAHSGLLIRRAVLRARREWGTTLVVASHDWQWLYAVCDQVLQFHQGRVFESGRGIVVTGPWPPATDGVCAVAAGDGQHIAVPAPPQSDAVAFLPTDAIRLLPPAGEPPPGHRAVTARIQRLLLEHRTDHLIATLGTGDHTFTLRLPPGQVREQQLYPGRRLQVAYRLEDVHWL